ncbi:MAG: hypothetical protein HOK97_16295, partial [Deltaproteobacteria bacterium]|nr:hypothetical protein [Deltaproteobacteria bacterium]
MTMRLLHCCFILIALTCTKVGSAKPILTDAAQCDTVELLADALDCDAETCNLVGNATVTCQDLVLQADSIVIQMTPDYGFNGATASGNVVFLDGDTLIRCSEVNLEAGRIQGKIEKAQVQVFENHATAAQVAANPRSPRSGRALQTVRGDIHRVSKDRFTLKSGTFTLCDCGGDQNPSWRLGASEVDVTLKDRATLWWPKLEVNFLGLGMLPLPLPTPVLSLPIQKRAAGLLAPSIIFLRDAYPILDFPLFIPIGNSYDLTVSPGLRTDWGLHRGNDVSTWSAPRLGARVRYAPIPGLQGSVQFQWTRDTHFTAARLARLNESHSGLEDPALIALARQDPRWGLRDRVVVQAGQTWLISPAARWNLKAHWVSDDYIQRDFSFHLADQVSQYLPSRTRLDWHTSHILVSAQADYLQRLNNGNSEAGYSNTSSNEGSALQRAPNMELWLRPQHLGQRFFVGGGLVVQRYGSWASPQTQQTANQWDFYQRLDFSYLNQVGPFQLKVQAGSHLIGMLSESDQSAQDATDSVNLLPFAELRLRSTLAKKFSQITHIVQPFVAVQFVYDPAINDSFSTRNPW